MESWSGALDGFSLIAGFTKGDEAQQTLRVHVQSGDNAWRGSIVCTDDDQKEASNTGNCAVTRGSNLGTRAFSLMRAGTNEHQTVRINQGLQTRLIVSSQWGTEFGISGVFVPVAEVRLEIVEPNKFYDVLFDQLATNRDREQKAETSIKKLKTEIQVLRDCTESMKVILPKRREQLVNSMKDALNEFKKECRTGG